MAGFRVSLTDSYSVRLRSDPHKKQIPLKAMSGLVRTCSICFALRQRNFAIMRPQNRQPA